MSITFKKIQDLVKRKETRISSHGYEELAEDDIFLREIMAGIEDARLS